MILRNIHQIQKPIIQSLLLIRIEEKMNNVLSIEEYQSNPHITGPCICARCGHRWIGVMPIPIEVMNRGFQCPECMSYNGFLEYPVPPNEDEEFYQCNCGSIYFSRQRDSLICAICGIKHLDV